ncbi:MAG: pyruvate kinase [Verrucomicrobiota bacterium]|nr:pyruvate kinase [Verrucomicrobiota bacterium]MEE2813083.1 pyruvate kinase [Verrucomicrobiota bacterium]
MQEANRQTQILVTLGPVTQTEEMIGALMDAGANLFRLNMSHARHDWVREVVANIRTAAAIRDCVPAILMDLQGPAIRTGDLPAPVDLVKGERFDFTTNPEKEGVRVARVNYPSFLDDIEEGATILIDNGLIRMKVLHKTTDVAECEVEIGGNLGSRRHINLPGTKVNLPALTEKDKADVAVGLELDIDYFALSFVREAADVEQLKLLIQSEEHPPRVVAKVEDQHAVKQIKRIIRAADAIMVARGDLGVECPYEELPIIQRRIVRQCLKVGKPVVVATHMLESMINEPHPTRAEVTDVANAVFEQADAIMLSGETSVGQFPVMCVEVMDRIARRMEQERGARFHKEADLNDEREKLAKSAVGMADDLNADAMVVFTVSGRMVRESSWMRPKHSQILALCASARVAGEMALFRGVRPVIIEGFCPDFPVLDALATLKDRGYLEVGDTVVVSSSTQAVEKISNSVQIHKVA